MSCMSIRLEPLDLTDFFLILGKHKKILVHEWENELALIWHIKENKLALDLMKKPLHSKP